jgi:hypothetical protein
MNKRSSLFVFFVRGVSRKVYKVDAARRKTTITFLSEKPIRCSNLSAPIILRKHEKWVDSEDRKWARVGATTLILMTFRLMTLSSKTTLILDNDIETQMEILNSSA